MRKFWGEFATACVPEKGAENLTSSKRVIRWDTELRWVMAWKAKEA